VKAPGVSPEARTAREDDTAGFEAQASFEEYMVGLNHHVRDYGEEAVRRGDPNAFDDALAAIRDAAELGPFSADDVVFPGSRRVLGSAFSFLRKSGEIECIGYAISRRPARHGGLCRQWRAV
jgi:hypothetical protein